MYVPVFWKYQSDKFSNTLKTLEAILEKCVAFPVPKAIETKAFRVIDEVLKYIVTDNFCLNIFLESILVRRVSALQRKLLMLSQQHVLFHRRMFNNLSQHCFKHSCFSQVLIAFIF